jgi:dihydropteroate synthase
MGVINVTPDSFSDGGRFASSEAAVAHALRMVEEGAGLIDVGGESTRPGAQAVDAEEEIRRVVPVIEALAARTTVPISIDTSKPAVMTAAVRAGARMINDVRARGRSSCATSPISIPRPRPRCSTASTCGRNPARSSAFAAATAPASPVSSRS